MFDFLERTALVMGAPAVEALERASMAVLGLGGVGGSAAEALCRAGVGHLLLVDSDQVSHSNLNRQLLALHSTQGQYKTEAARRRLLDINPQCDITVVRSFYLPENSDFLFDWGPHVVLDAIDTVTAKLHLAQACRDRDIGLVSSMGTGNRKDPSCLRLGDVSQTAGNGCPLARVMRRELKKRGVEQLETVYSVELPVKSVCAESEKGRHAPGSTPFVPPAAGYLLAFGAVRQYLRRQGLWPE